MVDGWMDGWMDGWLVRQRAACRTTAIPTYRISAGPTARKFWKSTSQPFSLKVSIGHVNGNKNTANALMDSMCGGRGRGRGRTHTER